MPTTNMQPLSDDLLTPLQLITRHGIPLLQQLLRARLLQVYSDGKTSVTETPEQLLNQLEALDLPYLGRALTLPETICWLTVLTPHLAPFLFEKTVQEIFQNGADIPEIGGYKGQQYRGMLPTLQTIIFLLSGTRKTNTALEQILENNFLLQTHVLVPEAPQPGEPISSAKIYVDENVLQNLLNVQQAAMINEQMFPAQQLKTGLHWDDLVLHEHTREQLNYLFLWLQHHSTLQEDWGFSKYHKQGFKALFHGHSGTGKTLAATLLGNATGMPVYRIDLSAIVSKYIGETEKNLSRLFQKAEYRNWILFFDEADALFGKRTQVQQSHDRYANQEVAFLLQRLETYPGLVILASNIKSNIDEAFLRRFDLVIHFPKPTLEERITLFYKHLPKQLVVKDAKAIEQLLQQHEISGANILNIMQYLSLSAIHNGHKILDGNMLLQAIRLELTKEDKLG